MRSRGARGRSALTNSEGATRLAARGAVRLLPTATGSPAATRVRAMRSTARSSAKRTVRCNATIGTRRRARRRISSRRSTSDARPVSAPSRRLGARKLATLECPVAVRSADGDRAGRSFRQRGQRRQPLPQVVVPARQPGQRRCSAAASRFARSRICRADRRRRPSTTKASRRSRATWCSTVSCRVISSVAIRRASSA